MLDHRQQVAPKAQQETGQDRNGVAAGCTQPAPDPDQVILPPVERFAPVEAVSDERVDGLAVRALPWVGDVELLEMVVVVLDSAWKIVYNRHACIAGLAQGLRHGIGLGQASPFSR